MSRKLNGAIAAALVLGAVIAASNANADFFEGLGFLPGYDYSEAVGVSANGKRIAGNIVPIGNEFDGASQAFPLDRQQGGMIGLGYPTGDDVSRAVAISGNGSKIIGYRRTTLAGGAGFTSFVWSATRGVQSNPESRLMAHSGRAYQQAINANGRSCGWRSADPRHIRSVAHDVFVVGSDGTGQACTFRPDNRCQRQRLRGGGHTISVEFCPLTKPSAGRHPLVWWVLAFCLEA